MSSPASLPDERMDYSGNTLCPKSAVVVERKTNWNSDINKFAGLNGDLARPPLAWNSEWWAQEKIDYDSLRVDWLQINSASSRAAHEIIENCLSAGLSWLTSRIHETHVGLILQSQFPRGDSASNLHHLPSLFSGSHFFCSQLRARDVIAGTRKWSSSRWCCCLSPDCVLCVEEVLKVLLEKQWGSYKR